MSAIKNFFDEEIEFNAMDNLEREEFAPGMLCDLEVDLLDKQSLVVCAQPPSYLRHHTSKVMDIIEQLEEAIGVTR